MSINVLGYAAHSAETPLGPFQFERRDPPAAARASAPAATAPPTTAQRMFGDISPKFAELTDKVLFGDVWERPGLSKRDRSLVRSARSSR